MFKSKNYVKENRAHFHECIVMPILNQAREQLTSNEKLVRKIILKFVALIMNSSAQGRLLRYEVCQIHKEADVAKIKQSNISLISHVTRTSPVRKM